jgi:hypothetical protein
MRLIKTHKKEVIKEQSTGQGLRPCPIQGKNSQLSLKAGLSRKSKTNFNKEEHYGWKTGF